MRTIQQHFTVKPKNNLSVYFTAGYPSIEAISEIILTLQECGVDFIEVGMPFSDPVADGPVITRAHETALQNGMTIDRLFNEIERIKEQLTIPIIYMGYINPIYRYGFENFCRRCQETGFSGAVVPDLPHDLYIHTYKAIFTRYKLSYLPIVTPNTSSDRLEQIAKECDSFIYLVSTVATTGCKSDVLPARPLQEICQIIQNKPIMVGFGVDSSSKRHALNEFSAGVIVGTAFIKLLEVNPVSVAVKRLLEQLS